MGQNYQANSLTLIGTVAMGTGVMIGAGIFALTGQVAEFAGGLFPLAFLVAAIISGFSAYSYIRVTSRYPSAGGIAKILQKAYGTGMMTGSCALLMAISMIINESLVARTFAAYSLQLFDVDDGSGLVPVLAVGIIVFAFLVNIAGNKMIGGLSAVTAIIKIGGIVAFACVAMWASGFSFEFVSNGAAGETSAGGFLAAVALAILAYKGFTTIANSGGEVKNPHKNVGRAMIISLGICVFVYMFVAFGVGSSLTIAEIVQAKDYSLAEAARPAFGQYGLWFTVGIAIVATASGLLASVFAVSRMLTMLTEMRIIPHSHLGMPGNIHKHTLVYTVVTAALLAAFFDLSRIASLGAIFYLVMDIAIHWGVFRSLRKEVHARAWVLITAIVLDVVVLVAFLGVKGRADPSIVVIALIAMASIFAFEKYFLSRRRDDWTTVSASHTH